jgi:hypothetical protein
VHRSIEILIGMLITDGEFRHFFLHDPRMTLQLAGEWGLALSDSEVRAIIATDQSLWGRVGDQLDVRLQRAGTGAGDPAGRRQ